MTVTIKNGHRADSVTPTHEKPQMNGSSSKLSIVQNASEVNANSGSKATNGVKVSASAHAPSWNGPEQDNATSVVNGDPFTKTASTKIQDPKLSGGALDFKPNGPKPAPISFLNSGSEADDGPVIVSSSGSYPAQTKLDKGKGKAQQEPIGTRGANFSPTRPRVYFTTDVGPDVVSPGGHYLKIENISAREVDAGLEALYETYGWGSKVQFVVAPATGESNHLTFFCCFDDVRDAAEAAGQVEIVNPNWNVRYISHSEYANGKKACNADSGEGSTTFFDGQAQFIAVFQGSSSDFSADGLFEHMTEVVEQPGDIIGIVEKDVGAGNMQYRVEWCSIAAAKATIQAVTKDSPHKFGKWTITAEALPEYTGYGTAKKDKSAHGTPQKLVGDSQVVYSSPTGRTTWTVDENGKEVIVHPGKQPQEYHGVQAGMTMTPNTRLLRSSAPGFQTPPAGARDFTPRSGSWPGQNESYGSITPYGSASPYENYDDSTHPNKVRRERIENGQDVRTTVMLRNVPRHWTADDFRGLLDVVNRAVGTHAYDFSYLRYNFAKNQGVGYAFVNFTDPMYILPLLDAFDGIPWGPGSPQDRRRGLRLAEVCYATIQGLDCCHERFRNSSIMEEAAAVRPKSYYTEDTAPHPSLIGQERPFPGINNAAKHQRSCDNAAQIGLYAPRSHDKKAMYQQRRSQYDRGTTAQMNDDARYNQMAIQNGYGMQHPNYAYGAGPMQTLPNMPAMPIPGMHFGYPHPMAPVGPVMPPNMHGFVHFTDPFNGGPIAVPNAPPAPQHHMNNIYTMNNGRRGPGPRPPQDTTVAPRRTYEEAVRGNAENARVQALYDAGHPVQINGHVLQNHDVRAHPYRVAPRVIDGEENEEGMGADYSDYYPSNGSDYNAGPPGRNMHNGGY